MTVDLTLPVEEARALLDKFKHEAFDAITEIRLARDVRSREDITVEVHPERWHDVETAYVIVDAADAPSGVIVTPVVVTDHGGSLGSLRVWGCPAVTRDDVPLDSVIARFEDLAVRRPLLLCPECQQAKHGNCGGDALDPATDDIVPCQCPDPSHA